MTPTGAAILVVGTNTGGAFATTGAGAGQQGGAPATVVHGRRQKVPQPVSNNAAARTRPVFNDVVNILMFLSWGDELLKESLTAGVEKKTSRTTGHLLNHTVLVAFPYSFSARLPNDLARQRAVVTVAENRPARPLPVLHGRSILAILTGMNIPGPPPR